MKIYAITTKTRILIRSKLIVMIYYVETLMFRSRHSSDWPEAVLVGVALSRSPYPQWWWWGWGGGVVEYLPLAGT